MKNTSFKTKLVARMMVLVLLLTSVLSFAGCNPEYNYYLNQTKYSNHKIPVKFRLRAKTDTFDINNVTLEVAIGLHKLSLFGKMDDFPRKYHPYGYGYNTVIGFALYICDGEFEREFPKYSLDIENIENHLFIREIPEEEAYTKEYGYNMFKYNHKENITIPSEYLQKDEGCVVIKLASYIMEDDIHYMFVEMFYNIVIEYSKTSDNQVIITNFSKRWLDYL